MYENIPEELRRLPQWVCWRYETGPTGKPTKVPYNPATGHTASVTDAGSWAPFDHAAHAAKLYYDGIGFVLTEHDPYCAIDLDNKPHKPATEEELSVHNRILSSFVSYTERSPSGLGFHIICRGSVGRGRERGSVGLYSQERYITFTGAVVREAAITDQQPLLDRLIEEMPSTASAELDETATSHLSDLELWEIARNAVNGDKFEELCVGDWKAMGYSSQSEADLALLSILAFYTQDNEQVRRLFRMSGLGKRAKAQKDNRYLDLTLSKIRAKQPPTADLSAIAKVAAELVEAKAKETEAVATVTPAELAPPPGLVGELAQYLYATAVRPIPEIALLSAIALTSGVIGRSYNISGTGLNQYIVLIARTGTGKESAAKGIESLLMAVRPRAPSVDQFIGPAAFASGQGLIRVLSERPCFMSLLGEFGLTLKRLTSPAGLSSSDIVLKQVILDLYGKSGWGSVLRSTAYSDSEKNTKQVHAPSVTIFGESTPDNFYSGLDHSHIAEGLIPRFHVIEYTGPRPARNRNAHCPPDAGLVARFLDLVAVALTTQQNGTCGFVNLDDEAQAILDDYDTQCDERINSVSNEGAKQLWNRAHLKALKLAALLAVGCDVHRPLVTAELARWAIAFTDRGTVEVLRRFDTGDIGEGESKQEVELRRVIDEYFDAPVKVLRNGYDSDPKLRDAGVVPYGYLRRRAKSLKCFSTDKRGCNKALKELLRDLVDAEVLLQLSSTDAYERFDKRMALFGRGKGYNG